jgi:dTDP-4-dehydrorhamnose reductase
MALDLPDLDIRDGESVARTLSSGALDGVVNCAAYTNVDLAESESQLAFAVNRDGAVNVAEACRTMRVPLVHISTDYVFDGMTSTPYREEDEPLPMGVYGLSKLEGEKGVRSATEQHYIVRTSWLYGVHGKNFVKTILHHAREKEELRVVSDQYGCPTWTMDLAEALCSLLERCAEGRPAPWGIYHFCNAGVTSWHRFAETIIREGGTHERLMTSRVAPIATAEYPTAAKRPPSSALDCQKIERTLGIKPPAWQQSLKLMLGELYREIAGER